MPRADRPVHRPLIRIILFRMKGMIAHVLGFLYRHIARRFFFLFDSEPIHNFFVDLGGLLGKIPGVPQIFRAMLRVRHPAIATRVAGIAFDNPIGLAAGFDHQAKLPRMLSGLGFGFGSVGTITNGAYGGNEYPRIKRLVRSKSLLVNKGFKTIGIDRNLALLAGETFDVPVGISLGRTNSPAIIDHESAITDIITAIRKTRESRVPFAYYELNISCPNLNTKVEFYEPTEFRRLLSAIDAEALDKPLFVKMPINLTNAATLALVDLCQEFAVGAVIFGNLQHDRSHPAFDKAEIAQFEGKRGNWSGMPCQSRSDELIALAYRHTRGALPIVGCGGTFGAADAYRKIRLGASLVQLATGLVFEGPQLPAEINAELPALLARDGFARVADAVGVDARGE